MPTVTATRRKERESQRRERKMILIQRVLGVALIVGSLGLFVLGVFFGFDVGTILIMAPLGFGLMFSKHLWL